MSSITISCIVFAGLLVGTALGTLLRTLLPGHHLSPESKDVVKVGMGLIGTMTALVLGLLIASAKSSFDTQRNGLGQLAGNIIFLDRILARYGPESKDMRDMLRASVADMLRRTWPQEDPQSEQTQASSTEGRYEGLFDKLQELSPKNETQRALQSQALKTLSDMAQSRWVLFAQTGSSIPIPFLIVLICWLALLMASFSLFAPPNATAIVTLMVCALAISSAIFLILELDRPFHGMIQISSAPVRSALAQLGR
jgi:hypothetical protein